MKRDYLGTGLQFPLVADMFLHLLQKHQPDVAIMFTNHVAGNMHRYWYALFPEDYSAHQPRPPSIVAFYLSVHFPVSHAYDLVRKVRVFLSAQVLIRRSAPVQ